MNTNMNGPTNDDIELLKGVRRVLQGLKRTGALFLVLSLVASVGVVVDYHPYSEVAVGVSLGLITFRGLVMMVNSAALLRALDQEIIDSLRSRWGIR